MLTQCPNCQTMFRVTSEILRVADGQVRCGRCQRQFDAMERLIEEHPGEPLPARSHRAPEPTIEVEEPATHEDITMEGRHIEISGTYRVPDEFGASERVKEEVTEEWVEIDGFDETEGDEGEIEFEFDEQSADENESFELVDDADPSYDSSAESRAEPGDIAEDAPASTCAPADQPIDDRPTDAPRESVVADAPIRATRPSRLAELIGDESDDASQDDLLALQPRRTKQSKIWHVLALPLLLLLIGQWAHSYRATLARHPVIGPPLLSAYEAAGIKLTPSWNLHAYQIKQWGIVSDPSQPGTLRVRASITNLADFAQPYPLLKLVLEDRWGEQLRAREFEPGEYLEPTIAADRLLNPGQQANATIAIIDPGPDAEGFRFDVCLRGNAGTVCGGEVPRR
jgi:predicted Zn finger-like uncharacterized protein